MKKIRKVVIPVAGLGTRFLPVTKSVPKEMLPIIDKPTIQFIVEEALAAGIEEVLFITNPYKNIILDHFDVSYELESRLEKNNKHDQLELIKDISNLVKVYSIRQGEPLGTGHAVSLARSFVGDEPFAVMYGDDLIKGSKSALKELVEVYEKYNCNVIGLQEVPHELTNKYGIVSLEDADTLKIKTIVEKPKVEDAPSNMAGLGRYILKPEIFDVLEITPRGAGNEYQLTDAMKELMKNDVFYGCKFSGTYYDIGNQLGYLKANISYALDREELSKDLIKFMKEIIK